MNDEIRIYHVDDPNDAPERRLSAFPTINPYLPRSLPTYVIPPVANSLMTLMQYHWYTAYQQGIATAQHQQNQIFQHHHQPQHRQSSHPINHTQHLDHHPLGHQQHQLQQHRSISPATSSLGIASSQSNASSSVPNATSDSVASSSIASPVSSTTPSQQKHQHIKKPLNPFMIYMQKRRPEIVKQGIIKESAAINQMLGQQWRKLTKEEQEPYYRLAEQEKILHAQKYPGWSARDNYANQKKKKKLKLRSALVGLDQSDKKCRARFGLTNMASWCKPCRRKKKCIFSQPNHHYHNMT